MDHLAELNLLIDQASKIAGDDTKLAKMIGQPKQHISNWRHGKRTATPEDQALMAAIAGLDATQVLARAMVAKHEGTAKGDLLMKALGKALLATGVALGSAGASAMGIYGWGSHAANRALVDTMYILSRLRKRRRLAFHTI